MTSISYRTEEWVDRLLAMANAAEIPMQPPRDDCFIWTDKEFDLPDGWKVSVFYDAGDLDYINHFVDPNGEIIDFWEWPDPDFDDPLRARLMGWRGAE